MKEADVKNTAQEAAGAASSVSPIERIESQGADYLDPSKNGVLDALNRIDKNTAVLRQNHAREVTANIRSLRRARASNPKIKIMPGSTVAPVAP
ncbi:MAG: hypothetical protein IBX50_04250, partial [Marinospirillum sp.]|uniref:hypothetical protein n=1 Tax=Marinospirillum sp. TaxID=2183934 RepID=UPI001A04323E